MAKVGAKKKSIVDAIKGATVEELAQVGETVRQALDATAKKRTEDERKAREDADRKREEEKRQSIMRCAELHAKALADERKREFERKKEELLHPERKHAVFQEQFKTVRAKAAYAAPAEPLKQADDEPGQGEANGIAHGAEGSTLPPESA